MAGFTIRCNNCGNEIITSDDYEAINGKIDVELVQDGNEEFVSSFIFCMKCDNSTTFRE